MESQYVKLTESEEKKVYPHALELVIHESDSLWQISNVFLIGNSVISAIISNNIFDNRSSAMGIFLISWIGLFITIIWLFSIERARNYHLLRIAQARQREPKSWMLMNGDVELFAKGKTIEIQDKKYNTGFGKFSNISLVRVIAIVFFLFYLGMIVYSWPFDLKSKSQKYYRNIKTHQLRYTQLGD